MSDSVTVRWGILGPGNIARTFTRNLLQCPPSARGQTAISHVVTAVASSTSLRTAQSFIDANVSTYQSQSMSCVAFSSYLDLVSYENVDAVYIATPHSSHFRLGMLALTHDKAVLIEKPIAINAIQAEILIKTARERKLFLMEAIWTRFFPVTLWIQDIIRQGRIGEVIRVNADFSMGCTDVEGVQEMFGKGENRMVSPNLAGGVLLDLGVYSLTWIFICVYHLLDNDIRSAPNLIGAVMTPYAATSESPSPWVDATTTLLLTLPSSPKGINTCHAVATTSLYNNTDPGYGGDDPNINHSHRYSAPSARIQGTKGEVQIFGPLPRIQRCRVLERVKNNTDDEIVPGNIVNQPQETGYRVEERVFDSGGDGNGMYWEADEVARCLKNGKLESEVMPWEESLAVMRVMDEARRRCGLDYGAILEGTNWQ